MHGFVAAAMDVKDESVNWYLLLILILITTELSNQKYILKDIDEFIFIAASNSMNWNDNEVLKYSTGTGTDTDSQ